MLRKMLGWGGGDDVNVPCTCTHVEKKKTPLIRYSNSSAPLTRTPPSFYIPLRMCYFFEPATPGVYVCVCVGAGPGTNKGFATKS